MPVKLERSLKRKVAGKNWSEERKDAYVYGTLRKTGWKPSTQKKEKKMNDSSKIIQLHEISKKLDTAIEFQAGMGAFGSYLQKNLSKVPSWTKTIGKAALQTGAIGAVGGAGVGAISGAASGEGAFKGAAKGAAIGGLGAAAIGGGLTAGAPALSRYIAKKPGYVKGTLSDYNKILRGAGYKGPLGELSTKQKRLVELNQRLNRVIEFTGNPADPSAGMFGGNDPGTFEQIKKNNAENSALQRLRLKIARLKAMGLTS